MIERKGGSVSVIELPVVCVVNLLRVSGKPSALILTIGINVRKHA